VDLVDTSSVAMWLPPDPEPPGEDVLPPEDSWALFTPEVQARFEILGQALQEAHPKEPHWYLGVLATVPEQQGRGFGARTVRPVLEICDRDGIPSHLESSNARNLPFYFRHGWAQSGELRLPDGPSLFPMWREPQRIASVR
jgi:GNAT superfamily N-acetyltransferase